MMNFGVYTRKSYYTDTSESTKMQLDACKTYISEKFDGIGDILSYEDDGYIRSNIDRPGMNQLRADAADGLIDCVVIYRIDRVCSQMIDFCTFYTFLKDRGIKFVTVKDGIDTTTPIGEAMMYLAVIFSGIEIGNDTIRITDNMNHLAASGYWCGGRPPLGYKIEQVSTGRKSHKVLVADQDGIDLRDQLVELFLSGRMSLQALETYCRKACIVSPSGRMLSTTVLHQILTSPMCVADTPEVYDYFEAKGCQISDDCPRERWDGQHGVLVYGRTKTEKKDGKKRHEKAPASEWRVSIGAHLPTLTADRWLAVQAQFSHNVFDKSMRYDTTLLKGVLRCKCGRLMSLARKKRVDGSVVTWYRCPRHERAGKSVCDMSDIKADLLDDKVLEIFRAIEHDPAVIHKYIKKAGSTGSRRKGSEAIREKIKQNDGKIEALTSALSENAASTAAKYIVGQIEKLDLEQSKLRNQLTRANAGERKAAQEIRSAEDKEKDISDFIRSFDNFTAAEKNEIARKVIRSATWDCETLKILL